MAPPLYVGEDWQLPALALYSTISTSCVNPAVEASGRRQRKVKPRCFAQTEAWLSRSHLPHLLSLALHAGAGGARNRAISDTMSANICCSTATSAIVKVA